MSNNRRQLPGWGGFLKRLRRPNLFRVWLPGFKGKLCFNILRGFIQFTLSPGLIKPQRGPTLVTVKGKVAEGQEEVWRSLHEGIAIKSLAHHFLN